jgi:integrase
MAEDAGKRRRPKSANGEGGGRIRENGTWEWRTTLGDGRRLSAYGKTRTEAKQLCLAKARQAAAGIDVKAAKQTVGAFLETWLADVVKPQLAPKTYASYRDTVRKHIIPTLGRIELAKLTPAHVQGLLREKERQGVLSSTTIAYVRTVLRIALNRALKWNLVERNVAALTDAPRKSRTEIVPLTPAQASAFLDTAAGDRLEALYLITSLLGLRLGEGLGLRWKDVDLETATLRVRQALQRVDGQLIFKEPKTEKSRRTLTLPAAAVEALRRHHDRQTFEAAQSPYWRDQGLVFTNTIGGPLEPSNVLKRFKATLASVDLPEQRFHDLRHYAATFMLALGIPMRVVMEILGHTQMATTADLYSHVMPAAHREVADLLDQAMAARKATQQG